MGYGLGGGVRFQFGDFLLGFGLAGCDGVFSGSDVFDDGFLVVLEVVVVLVDLEDGGILLDLGEFSWVPDGVFVIQTLVGEWELLIVDLEELQSSSLGEVLLDLHVHLLHVLQYGLVEFLKPKDMLGDILFFIRFGGEGFNQEGEFRGLGRRGPGIPVVVDSGEEDISRLTRFLTENLHYYR